VTLLTELGSDICSTPM